MTIGSASNISALLAAQNSFNSASIQTSATTNLYDAWISVETELKQIGTPTPANPDLLSIAVRAFDQAVQQLQKSPLSADKAAVNNLSSYYGDCLSMPITADGKSFTLADATTPADAQVVIDYIKANPNAMSEAGWDQVDAMLAPYNPNN